MKSTNRTSYHLRGEISVGPIATIFIISFVLAVNFCGKSTNGVSGGSSPSIGRGKINYCKYAGCTDSQSGFLEAGTGYCHRHAQQLRDEEKLIEKIKTQGY